jgi:ubiquinone/menaquinone biosynthesis C-methylase UbiE
VELVALIVPAVLVSSALVWWLLITTEGVYLGRRMVIWLYDLYARRYDRIKQYNPAWESATLGRPILRALLDVPAPMILDVATGTARLPLALFGQPAFNGYVIGLDYSRRMLAVAAEKLASIGHRAELIYQHAQKLPFDDATFDAVTCLEALEFMPNPDAVIGELVRVARPGALILITNRKGIEARLMPGKTQPRDALYAKLYDKFGLEEVAITAWQADYEQVWAFKPGDLIPAPDHGLEVLLRCPGCGQRTLARTDDSPPRLICAECAARIPIGADGVVEYAQAALVSADHAVIPQV